MKCRLYIILIFMSQFMKLVATHEEKINNATYIFNAHKQDAPKNSKVVSGLVLYYFDGSYLKLRGLR